MLTISSVSSLSIGIVPDGSLAGYPGAGGGFAATSGICLCHSSLFGSPSILEATKQKCCLAYFCSRHTSLVHKIQNIVHIVQLDSKIKWPQSPKWSSCKLFTEDNLPVRVQACHLQCSRTFATRQSSIRQLIARIRYWINLRIVPFTMVRCTARLLWLVLSALQLTWRNIKQACVAHQTQIHSANILGECSFISTSFFSRYFLSVRGATQFWRRNRIRWRRQISLGTR